MSTQKRRAVFTGARRSLGGRVRIVGGWLPGVLTLGNLLTGFGAILMAMQGRFWIAFWLIFAAGLLDALDGRVARLTGSVSNFGEQLDSLCDAVSFAVAPSLLAFQLGVGGLGRVGWAACFFYVACGVIRLARFNTAAEEEADFVGLPIPSAAAAASVPALMTGGQPLPAGFVEAYALVLAAVGLLMVSRVRYPSFKGLRFGPKPYRILAIWALILGAFVAKGEWVAPTLVLVYLLIPLWRVFQRFVPQKADGDLPTGSEQIAGDGEAGREDDRDRDMAR